MSTSRVQIRLVELKEEQHRLRYIIAERYMHYSPAQLTVFRRRLKSLKKTIEFMEAMHAAAKAQHKNKRHVVRP